MRTVLPAERQRRPSVGAGRADRDDERPFAAQLAVRQDRPHLGKRQRRPLATGEEKDLAQIAPRENRLGRRRLRQLDRNVARDGDKNLSRGRHGWRQLEGFTGTLNFHQNPTFRNGAARCAASDGDASGAGKRADSMVHTGPVVKRTDEQFW